MIGFEPSRGQGVVMVDGVSFALSCRYPDTYVFLGRYGSRTDMTLLRHIPFFFRSLALISLSEVARACPAQLATAVSTAQLGAGCLSASLSLD